MATSSKALVEAGPVPALELTLEARPGLANESRSQQGTWKHLTSKQGTWQYLTSKALDEAELINWSASLRGLREHLKSRVLLMIQKANISHNSR